MVHSILVGSGKGGVGKSTTAGSLATFLAVKGLSVGLLDADLAGPSFPIMFKHEGPVAVYDGMMMPVPIGQVNSMSIGYIAPADRAIVWSGAMLEGALWQMIHQTRWGPLDVMVVDLPPGTNELHVKILEEFGHDATAVLVTTEEALAIADTVRALDFYLELGLTPAAAAVTAGRLSSSDNGCLSVEAAFSPLTVEGIPTVYIPEAQSSALIELSLSAMPPVTQGYPVVLAETTQPLMRLAELCGVRF